MFGVLFVEEFVSIPIADSFAAGLIGSIEELHKSNAFLDESTGQDTVFGIGCLEISNRIACVVRAIELQDVVWF